MVDVAFKKGIIFILIVFVFISDSLAQKANLKIFNNDFSVFLLELESFMSYSDNSELKQTYKSFNKSVNVLSEEEKIKIIDVSNKMLKKRLKPKPHFNQFLNSLMVVDGQARDNLLIEWLVVNEQLLDHSTTKKFMLFSNYTNTLIQDKVLRESKTVTWSIESKDYSFSFNMVEPVVSFSSLVDLRCNSNGSTFSIYKTKGDYFPLSREWIGKEGYIDWVSQGLSKDSVFAILDNYKIDTRKRQLNADSCFFYNKYLFQDPLIGKVICKAASSKQSSNYPNFTSYSKEVELINIFPDVDYRGGYKLVGKDFIADGGDYAKARIVFRKDNKDIFIANANRFSIGSDKIISKGAGIKIFFDNDSIYHSNMKFKYIDGERKLELLRDRNSVSGAAMFNTYHKITMDFELMEWNIDTDLITFGSLPNSTNSIVNFESVAMYDSARYHSLQGIDAEHPLMLINRYVKEKNEDIFYVEDFARFAKFPLSQIEPYLIRLAGYGFIFYDFSDERITVQPKLYNYIRAASEIGDYDVISFYSIIEGLGGGAKPVLNAALNLSTKDLNIMGVRQIQLSKTRKVNIAPYGNKVVVKKNRDFVFNGAVSAGQGRLELYGREFSFDYEDFKLNLNKIDSIQLAVPFDPVRKDSYGREYLTELRTVIEAVTGDLRIDDPSNRSGIRKDSFPEFPIFRSTTDSYVYYDRKSIYDGVYNRNNFSFHLQPFEIDSLDNYTGKGLWFAGSFASADIFPVFEDTLRVQKDYSLGFNRKTPKEGFDIYSGKAKYYNNIHLSHQGLKGEGDFQYLTLLANADDIIFFPDSMNLNTNVLTVSEVKSGIEFPEVANTNTFVHFEPYNDKLNAFRKDTDFSFYHSKTFFNGNLLLQPTGLTGGGVMHLDNAEVNSDLFSFNASWFRSDTASLNVYESEANIAFRANNLRTHIDLATREGIFHSNGLGSYVELPANQYICYIDKLHWSMDEYLLTLGEDVSSSSAGTKFVSVHLEQDSLSFIAKNASYSLKDYIIHADGVNEMNIADAIIYPDSGVLTIAQGGFIQTLSNASILVDDLTEYHTFTSASVDIKSSNNYIASGDYSYIDAMNNEQRIFLSEITVNNDTITVAKGKILDDNILHLDDKFDFKGNVEIFSDRKNLTFDGYFMINQECLYIKNDWVKFRSEIDPKNIVFQLDKELYNTKKELLSTGLFMDTDSLKFYSAFLSKKRTSKDIDVFNSSSSSLGYNSEEEYYFLSGLDSLSNQYIFYDSDCKFNGQGEFNLTDDLGRVEIQNIGAFSHDMNNEDLAFEGFFMLDFFFSEDAMKVMAQDFINDYGDGIFEYDEYFSDNLYRILGLKKGEQALIDLEMNDSYGKIPKSLRKSIVFPKNKFIWDNNNQAYISKGDIWVSNINDIEVNALVKGYIVIEKGRNSDMLTVYLRTDYNYDEYYFQYKNGVMRAWSTNNEFMLEIEKKSDKKRRLEAKKGLKAYRYMRAEDDAVEKFLKIADKKYK